MDIAQRDSEKLTDERFVSMSNQLKNYSKAASVLRSVRSASESYKSLTKNQNSQKSTYIKEREYVTKPNQLKVTK